MERRPGRATARLQGALNATPEPDRVRSQEAYAQGKASRERFEQRRQGTGGPAWDIVSAILAVMGIVLVLWVLAIVIVSI